LLILEIASALFAPLIPTEPSTTTRVLSTLPRPSLPSCDANEELLAEMGASFMCAHPMAEVKSNTPLKQGYE
jgi:hypothetical protein